MERVVRTVCQGCHSECGVLVQVSEGKVIGIKADPDHPSSRGFICIKGRKYAEVANHPDRLKHPLRRKGGKGEGKWERVTWDQALDEIAAGLTAIKERFGASSIATFHGTAPRQSLFSCRLLAAALGTPNVGNTDLHICYAPSIVAEIATYGCSVLQEEGPDYLSSKCIFACGANPLLSHPPRGRDLIEGVRKNGAKLIVVDPRRTALAAQADMWLQIRPGAAVALILGMLNTIISEGLYDREFVEGYCHGFEDLKRHIERYVPESLEAITWVSAREIREAARLFAGTHPGVVHHRVGTEQDINSTQTNRSLAILAAITGNLGVKGGNLLPTHVPGYIPTRGVTGFSHLPAETGRGRVGREQFPLISGPEASFIFVHPALVARATLTGEPYPWKALFVAGANPVVNMQNTRRTWEAFKAPELSVVVDFFMTPTAETADYVLPATTWLEREECCDEQYMGCAVARQKAIEPVGESRDDMEIIIDLVRRLPWADRQRLPWKSTIEFNDWRVKGMGMTFDEFKRRGYVSVEPAYYQYKKDGFRTPTKKVEIYSTLFEKYGYEPLPIYVEPPESPFSTPELMESYPYILITGGRTIEYYLSAGRQIKSLRDRRPDPEIDIHPAAAARAGFAEGDWVWVETPQIKGERARFKVRFFEGIDPRVVHVPHGWWFPERPEPDHGCFESNIAVVLSDDPPREPICGSVRMRGTLCRISR